MPHEASGTGPRYVLHVAPVPDSLCDLDSACGLVYGPDSAWSSPMPLLLPTEPDELNNPVVAHVVLPE